MTYSEDLAKAATDYLWRGLSIIALSGKAPNVSIHQRGLYQPLALDTLDEALAHPATTGIGIIIPFPYVVVDIDGEEGALQFRDLITPDMQEDPLDVALESLTWTARTPRGMHLWFATTEDTGSIKLGPKLDLKGRNSYVVAPPSAHPDGGYYQWLIAPWESNVLEAPTALEKRIKLHKLASERRVVGSGQRKFTTHPRFQSGDTVFYAQAGWDAVIAKVETADEGNRNNMLHWAAATLAEEDADPESFLLLELAAKKAGLDRVEVGRTVRSARRKFSE